ncbi:MAG: hypothetical protein WCJ66_05815 [Verrucomicrobiota bacterium]
MQMHVMDAETKAIRRPIVMANSFELNSTSETLPESFAWENTHKFNSGQPDHSPQ